MKKHTIYTLATLIVISTLLAACSKVNGSSGGDQLTAVRIANMNLSVLNVAREAGYLDEEFADYQVKIEWSQHPNGPPINEGIASKRIDLAVLGEGAIVGGANNDLDTVLISLASDGLVGVNSIIAHKDSGVQRIEDLQGKKVGVAVGTSHHVFLLKVLDKAGLSIDDIEVVNLAITDAHPAFQTGQIDAWVTADTYANIEAANGAVLITNAKEHQIYSPTFYIARGEFAQQHPEIVEAYLRAIDRAIDLAESDYDQFIEFAAKAASQEVERIKAYEFGVYQNEAPSDELLDQFQQSVEILKSLNYVNKDISIEKFIDTNYINKLKAE
ncbi:ABC transporter substrate-binding protein [Paenibacillus sp. FSL W7-1287]|uniref:ABC transporter substrate-binding protein n=1 Tax=Paenibacillus sp. FSL W7-1287 TaxID=2954538 RepID=UPI0030F6D8B2